MAQLGYVCIGSNDFDRACTFYDALGRRDGEYLIARAIQCFVPGVPQVYYVGLLAGGNDIELLRRTGVGRDINRHHYTAGELEQQLKRPVVRSLLALLRLRNTHAAFHGSFRAAATATDRWSMGTDGFERTLSARSSPTMVAAASSSARHRSNVPSRWATS